MTMEVDGASGAASKKRKRCAHADNELLVEELLKLRSRVRESTHLSFSYQRAITSIQLHTERISSGQEAKQLKHIGNYMANQIQSVIQKQSLSGQPSAQSVSAQPAQAVVPPAAPVPPRRPVAQPPQQVSSRPAQPIPSQNTTSTPTDKSVSSNAQRIYAPSYKKRTY